MARVTGIGGVLFRASDPAVLGQWYQDHLGIGADVWNQEAGPTAWAPLPMDTDYIGGAEQQVMINFRVDDLDEMLVQLRSAGVPVDDEVLEEAGLGRFAHFVDPAGHRVELWEAAATDESRPPEQPPVQK